MGQITLKKDQVKTHSTSSFLLGKMHLDILYQLNHSKNIHTHAHCWKWEVTSVFSSDCGEERWRGERLPEGQHWTEDGLLPCRPAAGDLSRSSRSTFTCDDAGADNFLLDIFYYVEHLGRDFLFSALEFASLHKELLMYETNWFTGFGFLLLTMFGYCFIYLLNCLFYLVFIYVLDLVWKKVFSTSYHHNKWLLLLFSFFI